MKTDKWFYELFLSQPGILAELVPVNPLTQNSKFYKGGVLGVEGCIV